MDPEETQLVTTNERTNMQVETPSMPSSFMGVAPTATGTMASGNTASTSTSASRYESLLQQLVQLNTDLQKTAALSQSLQRERDGLQLTNHKLADETKRLHERCEKLQLVLMQETEHRIESDKKHEELIAKWKKQLELKAKAFENLQTKFAPPRDLEQLRMQIQEELEEPHAQRVVQLQQDVEKQRTLAFTMRREYEIVKTEYEQFAVDQGNEMECLHATYEMKLNDLKRKLTAAEQSAREAQSSDVVRRLEQQKMAALVEVKLLQDEVNDLRGDIKRLNDSADSERSEAQTRLAEEMARCAGLELDAKAAARQLARVKDYYEAMRSKWDHAQTKLLELTNDSDKLREQLKQKEQLVLSSHQATTAKLRDEREAWDRERSSLKERVSELTMKLQAAENAVAQRAASRRGDSDDADDEEGGRAATTALLKAKDEEIDKLRQLAATMERKVAEKEDQLRAALIESEDSLHKSKGEAEQLRQSLQALEMEREHTNAKQSSTQELLSKMKSECMMLRTKLKEIEIDYRTLQAKHRETIQLHEDIELEKEQMDTKLKFAETDCAALREKLEREKEDHAATVRDWQSKCSRVETEARAQKNALREETKRALSKALRELGHAQKKRDAFKQKCLEIHGQYKHLANELQSYESRVLQLNHDHASELQHLLTQLAQVENDKTALLQRQMAARPT